MLSITKIELANNTPMLSMWKPPQQHITRYADKEGSVTYIYLINDMEILSINGIYNKTVIENNYDNEYSNEPSYYIPTDVVVIDSN